MSTEIQWDIQRFQQKYGYIVREYNTVINVGMGSREFIIQNPCFYPKFCMRYYQQMENQNISFAMKKFNLRVLDKCEQVNIPFFSIDFGITHRRGSLVQIHLSDQRGKREREREIPHCCPEIQISSRLEMLGNNCDPPMKQCIHLYGIQ